MEEITYLPAPSASGPQVDQGLGSGPSNAMADAVARLTATWTLEQERLFAIAKRIVRRDADAADCVMNAWVQLAPVALALDNMSAVLCTTVRNAALRVLRDRKRVVSDMFVDEVQAEGARRNGSSTLIPDPEGTPSLVEWILSECTRREYAVVKSYLFHHGIIQDCARGQGLDPRTVTKILQGLGTRLGVARMQWRSLYLGTKGSLPGTHHAHVSSLMSILACECEYGALRGLYPVRDTYYPPARRRSVPRSEYVPDGYVVTEYTEGAACSHVSYWRECIDTVVV